MLLLTYTWIHLIYILFQLYLKIFFLILCSEYDMGNILAGSSFE